MCAACTRVCSGVAIIILIFLTIIIHIPNNWHICPTILSPHPLCIIQYSRILEEPIYLDYTLQCNAKIYIFANSLFFNFSNYSYFCCNGHTAQIKHD